MNKRRVFILGAGFSKQVGMPLATELTDLLLERFQQNNIHEMLEWYESLKRRIHWMGDNSINIEQVFDLAHYDIMAWRMKQQQGHISRKISSASIKVEERRDWLNWMERDLSHIIWDKQNKAMPHLKKIMNFSQNLQIDDVILTFNYDTLLEKSLTKKSKKWHYGFNLENGHGVKILKMHGSINWKIANRGETNSNNGLLFRKENLNVTECNTPEPVEPGDKYELALITDDEFDNFIIQNSKIWKEINCVGIAGLGAHKQLHSLPGSWEVWSNAMNALEETDEIYIVGFSLSLFDSMVRLNFAGAMLNRNENGNLPKKIILIDPYACDLKQKYQSVFGSITPITVYQSKAEQIDWNHLLNI